MKRVGGFGRFGIPTLTHGVGQRIRLPAAKKVNGKAEFGCVAMTQFMRLQVDFIFAGSGSH